MNVITVAGARPNFMKIAPLQRAFDKYPKQIHYKLIHTGQHYDDAMSAAFFRDLNIRKPNYVLDCGGGGHGAQTGRIMIACEKVLQRERPDILVVVGDVNSTVAAALVAKKLGIRVAHIEAGCRSFDRSMPEEINRIVTDSISDYLFCIDRDSADNLDAQGISRDKIFLVGDSMLDSLMYALKPGRNNDRILRKYGLGPAGYGVLTMHRPANVDNEKQLHTLVSMLGGIDTPLIFPVHPRTLKNIRRSRRVMALLRRSRHITMIEPLGYFDFISLFSRSRFVITDSGSIQLETSFLNIPCLTLRDTTERPVTITHGTNELVGSSRLKLMAGYNRIIAGTFKRSKKMKLWDGRAADRIARILSGRC